MAKTDRRNLERLLAVNAIFEPKDEADIMYSCTRREGEKETVEANAVEGKEEEITAG